MMHQRRRWCVSSVATAEELAEKLHRTWTLCTGFFVSTHPRYLFLNDATHEDGAAEFGVVTGGMEGPHVQIGPLRFLGAQWPRPWSTSANRLLANTTRVVSLTRSTWPAAWIRPSSMADAHFAPDRLQPR